MRCTLSCSLFETHLSLRVNQSHFLKISQVNDDVKVDRRVSGTFQFIFRVQFVFGTGVATILGHQFVVGRLGVVSTTTSSPASCGMAGACAGRGPANVPVFYIWVPSSFSELVSQQFWVTSSL
jgi:hypothetical protein